MEKREYSGGMSAGTLLQVTLIILKLTKVITWPWVWVLAPTWIGLGLGIVLIIVLTIVRIIVKKVKGL